MQKPLGGLARAPRGFAPLLFIASLVPAVGIVGAMLGDLFAGTRFLSADPVKEGEHMLGEWVLRLLFATLAVTPLRRLTGWNWLARHRRSLGLFAFAYVALHLLTWALLDVQIGISEFVGWGDVTTDVLKRPYITIGMLGFVLMIPLAVTSTRRMVARLGRRWRALHRLIYAIAVLGIVHYLMAVKKDVEEPLMYGAFLAGLFVLRYGVYWRGRRSHTAAG